jgi:hypothetical protein
MPTSEDGRHMTEDRASCVTHSLMKTLSTSKDSRTKLSAVSPHPEPSSKMTVEGSAVSQARRGGCLGHTLSSHCQRTRRRQRMPPANLSSSIAALPLGSARRRQ